jgi:3-deoxy-D-manno-octulosonic-acid transferase
MLSQSYFYADLVYIGGGFNDGIHNILEPAVYHIPVSFYGSDFVKYNEATDLVKIKAAFNVLNEQELMTIWQKFLQNKTELEQLQTNLDAYFARNSGVTDKVMKAMVFS